MQALCEYRLDQALRKARQEGERLIIYEDGGYIVAKIYEIYKDPSH
jgi:adenine specific DNA methylase Mod